MKKTRKILFINSRMIGQNGGQTFSSAETPIPDKEQQTLGKITETVRQSYEQQLQMMNSLKITLKPITEEIDQYWSVVKEMHAQVDSTGTSQKREIQILGEKILIEMDTSGTFQEFRINEGQKEEINFYNWALQKKQSSQNQ